ncbi:MAG TPA: DsbA family protein [Euzebyales bacterium]
MDHDVEFFFDPVCPFCWVTSRWVRHVQRLRDLSVRWRFISLRLLNEGHYEDKPRGYPAAHQRGLEMLRVAAAVRAHAGEEVMGDVYDAFGGAVWRADPPTGMDVDLDEAFDAVLEHSASAGDLPSLLDGLGLPTSLAAAAQDPSHDTVIRDDTDEALARVGGDIGTPVLSFLPPDGPAFFGPVISESPDDDDEALALWDAVTTLARWPGFAELKRSLREFPMTRVTAPIAGRETQVS